MAAADGVPPPSRVAGLRQIAPDTYPGIDFTEEYRLAAAMREAQRG